MNVETLVKLVVTMYLETGKDVDVSEIAEKAGCSTATIRKVLTSVGGCPPELVTFQEERPSFSKSYRMFQTGTHKVWVYSPSKVSLRKMLLDSTYLR